MLPDRRTDDAALLLVRTHALDPHHVADWDVEPPIRLRLIRDTSLIDSEFPGARHTSNGKTIWCAQTLPASGP
ncbi:hypothetical protein GCM10018780_59490 [Streptomyces lanatus]|nr:hypothetical protein GCM10018780_59490 [Streptomyces lanatus]